MPKSKPPYPSDESVKLQFVATLDGWVSLEHALDKLFYVLLKPIAYPRARMLFNSMNGFQAQREAVSALANDALTDPSLRKAVGHLLDRARKLATKRNRLVHGGWIHFAEGGEEKDKTEGLMRFYKPANYRQFMEVGKSTHHLKGKYFFYFDDLVRCEDEFRALAQAVTSATYDVAKALGVSPHIQIPIEEVLELKIQENPPSGRPPENP